MKNERSQNVLALPWLFFFSALLIDRPVSARRLMSSMRTSRKQEHPHSFKGRLALMFS